MLPLRTLVPAAATALLLSACGPVLVADDARKREAIKRQHAEVWSEGRLDRVDALYAADFVGRFPGTRVEGRAALKAYLSDHRERHPDWQESVEYVIVEGNRAASHAMVRGARQGELARMADPGGSLDVAQSSLFEFEGGRIVRQWMFLDFGGRPEQ